LSLRREYKANRVETLQVYKYPEGLVVHVVRFTAFLFPWRLVCMLSLIGVAVGRNAKLSGASLALDE
jgi:hypothetical protein